MKTVLFALMILPLLNISLMAQQERKYIRKGVKEYHKDDFGNAEVNFRKALDENDESWEASFNTGNSLYKQDKSEDAVEMYNQLLRMEGDKNRKADIYYNIGNSFLKEQQYEKSIDAYKNALRNRPEDEDARYNLAYALSMLSQDENQQDQQQDQQEGDQDGDQDDQQDQQESQDGEDNRQNQPEERQGLSREEAERILQALQDREEEIKEEVEKKAARPSAVPVDKEW